MELQGGEEVTEHPLDEVEEEEDAATSLPGQVHAEEDETLW